MVERYEVVPVRRIRRTHIGLIVLLIVVAVVALGFYRGWFQMGERETENNKVDVNLRIDPDKMKSDVRKAADATEQKASKLSSDLKQEAKEIKGRVTDK
jgi:hypothetical protein